MKIEKAVSIVSPMRLEYMPWGADNQMPYHVLDMIEKDETLSTCQIFNAEECYVNGLQYNTEACTKQVEDNIQDFLLCNNMATYIRPGNTYLYAYGEELDSIYDVLLRNDDKECIALIKVD